MRRTILALAVVAASGCGGGGSADSPPQLPHALGTQLAAQADAVEASLARGDDCGAEAQAEELRQMISQAVSADQVPVRLRAALSRSAGSLAGEIVCAPAPTAAGPPADGNGQGEDQGPAKDHKPGKHHRPGKDHRPGHDHEGGGED